MEVNYTASDEITKFLVNLIKLICGGTKSAGLQTMPREAASNEKENVYQKSEAI